MIGKGLRNWIRVQLGLWTLAIVLNSSLLTRGLPAGGLVTAGEMKEKDRWTEAHLLKRDPDLPFSFIYEGKVARTLLAN